MLAGTIIAQDTFQRANVASGWGTATDGNTWTQLQGVAGDLAVTANEGFSNGGEWDQLYLGNVKVADAEILVRYASHMTNGGGPILRVQSSNTFIHFRCGTPLSTEQVWFRVQVSGSNTDYGNVNFSFTNGTYYWFRARIQGNTMYLKVWQDGTAEPGAWTTTASQTQISGAGYVGMMFNESTALDVDHFTATFQPPFRSFIDASAPLRQFAEWGARSATTVARDLLSRIRVGLASSLAMRIGVRATQTGDLLTRILLAVAPNLLGRIGVALAQSLQTRVRVRETAASNLQTRARVATAPHLLARVLTAISETLQTRVRLRDTAAGNLPGRIRAGLARSLPGRALVAVADSLATRISVATQAIDNLNTRVRLRASATLDASTRIRLGVGLSLSALARVATGLSLSTRARVGRAEDLAGFVRLSLAPNLALRTLVSVLLRRDLPGRIQVGHAPSLMSRLLVARAPDVLLRVLLSATARSDLATRLLVRAQRMVDLSLLARLAALVGQNLLLRVLVRQLLHPDLSSRAKVGLACGLVARALVGRAMDLAQLVRLSAQTRADLRLRLRLAALQQNNLLLRIGVQVLGLALGNLGGRVQVGQQHLNDLGCRIRVIVYPPLISTLITTSGVSTLETPTGLATLITISGQATIPLV